MKKTLGPWMVAGFLVIALVSLKIYAAAPRNLGRKLGLRDVSHPCRRRGERTKVGPRNQDWHSRTAPGLSGSSPIFLALERRP
jgi:hypothetical protein